MKLTVVVLVLCASACLTSADIAHLKASKAKLFAKLAGKAHHKRGVLSAVPPFKLGHDFPVVSHSLVKPFVVTYPTTSAVAAVKVPLSNPLIPRYPIPVGRKVPVHHPQHGLKFPHRTKTYVLPKPDHHYHHHHHYVSPKPTVPVVHSVPASHVPPVVPVGQPTVVHPVPAPSPPVFIHPSPLPPVHTAPVAPPALQLLTPHHLHLKPAINIPLQPFPVLPTPLINYSQQFPYVIRPGNAIQTSVFATYPRYPLINYQAPLESLPAPAPIPVPSAVNPLLFERPLVPQFHVAAQGVPHNAVLEHHAPGIHVDSTPTLLHTTQTTVPQPTFHFQPTQPVPLDHDGWSPVPVHPDLGTSSHAEGYFPHQEAHHHFSQEPSTQVFEHHTEEQQYHDLQHQLQHHIQNQIEQAQFEQNNPNNPHQLNHEIDVHQQHTSGQEYGQPNSEFANAGHDFVHQAQEYAHHTQDFAQLGQELAHHNQEFAHHSQEFAHHNEELNPGHEYGAPQEHPAQTYGHPQPGVEGRSSEEEPQRYHNHIPLGLQPPLDRPLEHFR